VTEKIDAVLLAAVENDAVPGVVAMAANADGPIYEGAAGLRSAGAADLITPDTMMRIASMTKMVTSTAALQLVEQGRLDLSAPVDTYRPEFAEVQVLDGFDGDTPILRAPRTRATVHHLVTHTTGLGYWFLSADIDRYEQLTGTPNLLAGSMDAMKAPMTADPGTYYQYGVNHDWLGLVVEAISGQPLDEYFAEHITGPLGMTSTTARMTDEQRANSTPIHVRDENGAWIATDIDWPQQPDFWGGGHFLYSTPRDYLAFQRMLLGGGALGDVRILAEATVARAFTNQIGGLDFPAAIPAAHQELCCDVNLGPNLKWGHGLLLNEAQIAGMRAAGSGSWAGLFNTHFWVDPASGVTGAIYAQTLPFLDPAAVKMYIDFEQALYASL
jgi:methyl acetate hydrolase